MTLVWRKGLWITGALTIAILAVLSPSAGALDQSSRKGTSRTSAMKAEGLTIRPSRHGPKERMDRLAASVLDSGMAILARIDHAGAAAQAGLELRPTEVLIFGNPQAGTPLMQAEQTIGIDLPLKVLVWQDDKGETWLAFNDPTWLAERHGADVGSDRVLASMTEGLSALAHQATTETTHEAP